MTNDREIRNITQSFAIPDQFIEQKRGAVRNDSTVAEFCRVYFLVGGPQKEK